MIAKTGLMLFILLGAAVVAAFGVWFAFKARKGWRDSIRNDDEGEPGWALPSKFRAEYGMVALQAFIQRRDNARPAAFIFLMWETDGVMFAIGFFRPLADPIAVLVHLRKPANIDGPEIKRRFIAHHPFGQCPTSTAPGSNAEGVEAGADMVFPEAMRSLDDYQRVKAAVKVPILANLTEFGSTPFFTTDELRDSGVDIALYCCGAYRAMNKAALHFYDVVRREGTQTNIIGALQTRAELYDFLDYHSYEQKLDTLFASNK